jgi:hypothetical protein
MEDTKRLVRVAGYWYLRYFPRFQGTPEVYLNRRSLRSLAAHADREMGSQGEGRCSVVWAKDPQVFGASPESAIQTTCTPGFAADSCFTARLAPGSSGFTTKVVIGCCNFLASDSPCRHCNAGTAWHPSSVNISPSHITNPKS